LFYEELKALVSAGLSWDNAFELKIIHGTMAKNLRMLKEQFEIALGATRIRKPELIEAARALIVDGEAAPAVAARLGLKDTSPIYKAATTIQEKWLEICRQRNWTFLPVALPERMMRVVLEIQAEEFEDYQKGRRKKTP